MFVQVRIIIVRTVRVTADRPRRIVGRRIDEVGTITIVRVPALVRDLDLAIVSPTDRNDRIEGFSF